MSFRNALTRLTASEQTEVRNRLTTIAKSGRTGSHVEQNLFTESRLPLASAVDILNSLLGCVCDFGELKNAYRDACHRHILKGPRMSSRDFQFYTVLSKAILDTSKMEQLDAFDRWSKVKALPLAKII
jgi:hypothetical protein